MQTEHAVGWLNSKRTSLLLSILAFALTTDFDFLRHGEVQTGSFLVREFVRNNQARARRDHRLARTM